MLSSNRPAPFRGLAAGIAAGLAAALAMDQFQNLWARIAPPPSNGDDPATVKGAQAVSRTLTGTYFAKEDKQTAGNVAHYLFGAALGGTYGLAAEYWPRATTFYGAAFGLTTATAFDEIAVPAAGLSDPPTAASPSTHAYSYASHLVFGGVTEGVRRLLRRG